ncbi:hypothetical protein R70006_06262 [Paraburkholderia domus]|uniref:hypothetical protein n=1 Tax=Paraburkholderia domus TaxID=2793075 RepID=UPI001914B2A8|nr:hypothetical protein [Paraburkholderia domus]MBK5052893.1 hypothetical protein [Burkholderia sp. R-70006]CAE6822340.1 hypothetical protein R70006_06262 [Paraburkholderia domus]
MLRRISGVLLLTVSSLCVLFLLLHLYALAQMWGTPDLPAQWIENLGIALCIGAIGYLGIRGGSKLVSQPVRPNGQTSRAAR